MCLDLTLLASDFANLELFVFLRGPSWHDSLLPTFASSSLGFPVPLQNAICVDLLLLLCGMSCSEFPLPVSGDAQVAALPALDAAFLGPFLPLQGVSCSGPLLLVPGVASLELVASLRGCSRLDSGISLMGSATFDSSLPLHRICCARIGCRSTGFLSISSRQFLCWPSVINSQLCYAWPTPFGA